MVCRETYRPEAPRQDIAGAIGLCVVGVLAVVLIGVMFHMAGTATTAGVILANAPIAMTELTGKLDSILGQIKEQKDRADVETKKFGGMLEETKTKLEALQKQADAIDKTLAEKHAAAPSRFTLEESLKENKSFMSFIKGDAQKFTLTPQEQKAVWLERKTTVDSSAVGAMTSGVLTIDRTPGIVQEARQALTIRSALTARPTTMQVIDFVKVNSAMTDASPQQGEGHTKKENAVTFTTKSETIKTIATFIPASRQVLQDFGELLGFLQNSLSYYVDLAEEKQMLTGAGTGQDLDGLITQATAFNTGLLSASAGWTKIDIVGRAIQQITAAKELMPTFLVVHPNDWWGIRLTKDSQGRYIFPLGTAVDLFGLTPIVTTSVASGTFLVGSGSPIATEIRDRMGMEVEIATQHSTQFAENLVTIRAEKRLALVTYRPASFITGTFTTSP
jgi:HK97 family phage major capsid protein